MTYLHRNGDHKRPGESGDYWLDGRVGRTTIRDLVTVSTLIDGGELHVYSPVDGLWFPLADFRGRWWGPVLPPWEQEPSA